MSLGSDYPLIVQKNSSCLALIKFYNKCIGGQIKAFSFLLCTACDAKSAKYGECWYAEWFQNKMQKENRFIQCVYM